MGMTIQEAMRHIRIQRDFQKPFSELIEAYTIAIDALKEKAERDNPAPLTIEELRQMDGEPVYVSDLQRPGESEYCIIHANDKYGHGDEYRSAQIAGCECFWYDFETYGDTWIAYRHKPKEDTP